MTVPLPIRILIVDSHQGVRLGLAIALASAEDLLVVGQATGGAEMMRLCSEIRPDIVLMEFPLSDQDGINLIRSIRRHFPSIQVVVLTTEHSIELRRQALDAGASDYLQRYITVDALIGVIRTATAHPFGSTPLDC